MKSRDKLEQYIKREIESIPYEEENQMWKGFQKTNAKQLAKWNSPKYYLPFFFAGLLLIICSVIFYTQKKQSTITVNQDTHQPANDDKNTHSKNTEFSLMEKNNSTKEQIGSKEFNTFGNEENTLISQKTSVTKTETTNNFEANNTTLKNVNDLESRFAKKSSNETSRFSNTFSDQNMESFLQKESPLSISETSSFSNSSKSIASETASIFEEEKPANLIEEVEKNNPEKFKTAIEIASINSLWSEAILSELENNLEPTYEIHSFKRRNEWFVKALFSASTNEIYRSAFEIGKVKRLSQSKGLRYGLGVSIEDGYSVSQDSIYYISGVSTQEKRKDKDLDYLVSSYLATEFFIKKEKLSAAFGTRISYAMRNRFDGFYEQSTSTLGGSSWGSGEEEFFNLWTGINRLGVDASFTLSYRIQKFEFSFLTSKRITKLIKRNNAQRRKSNIPFQFGASLTKYF